MSHNVPLRKHKTARQAAEADSAACTLAVQLANGQPTVETLLASIAETPAAAKQQLFVADTKGMKVMSLCVTMGGFETLTKMKKTLKDNKLAWCEVSIGLYYVVWDL